MQYLSGYFFGKKKLFERISPNKTWEGAIGGAILTVLVGIVSWYFFKEYTIAMYVGFAVIIATVGSLGDLVQSMLKRSLNVKDSGKLMIVILAVSLIAYLISMLFKFSLSRSREYMADSGAAEMTRKPWALASALKKISVNHHVKQVKTEEVQQMFIENTPQDTSAGLFGGLKGLFSTHPPIEKRIQFLEQF